MRCYRFKGLSPEDMLLYQCIARQGNVGIWTKDIRRRTNLGQPQINKILKTLEERGLIKHVKSVQNASRKMYMLAELEPAKEITGGPWYGVDGKLDASFIEGMQRAVLGFVHSHGPATTADVLDFIEEKQICQLVLQSDDISLLLNNLVYEGSLEGRDDGDGDTVYRLAVRSDLPVTALASVPCGVCPVIHECVDGGPISPETCIYYQHWLDF
ncbi:hypothetical protein QBZ16_004506 [Prototheca wickerhamii]|uniref:DNA-directed RNA polymerase III subunit RPC6 n=1 Tax=Prototheca wickerhamii TaxID=3111 RepID=A0AAD9IJA2_PROWI|nr:hypothetical protein QBZ16_004506 [Prototheca wickerhamii]